LRLREGVQAYIEAKQSSGLFYETGAWYLVAFEKYAGNLPLGRISQRHVATFLRGPQTAAVTWHSKYNLLRGFFSYWVARRELSGLPMPPRRQPAEAIGAGFDDVSAISAPIQERPAYSLEAKQ
jgi:integrase/recombinase XerD